jgi:hypothetical protein
VAKVTLNIRLDPEMKAVLVALAAREHRSITKEIEALVTERAMALGLLPQGWLSAADAVTTPARERARKP